MKRVTSSRIINLLRKSHSRILIRPPIPLSSPRLVPPPQHSFTTMSWMDSWSRPGKSSATPPPLYLTHPGTKYCQTCGRLISDRKSHHKSPSSSSTTTATPPKYCSSKCRSQKPREARERKLERAFAALLDGATMFEGDPVPEAVLAARVRPKAKGERRIVVPCSAVETLVFGSRYDAAKTYGRRKNRASRALIVDSNPNAEWRSVDMEDDAPPPGSPAHADENNRDAALVQFTTTTTTTTTAGFAGKPRPRQTETDVNGSIGGEKGWAERSAETEEAAEKRMEGQRVAEERELVKQAARRCVVFGVEGRLCEAVMGGNVVEPSFAKGDWGVRWRE